MALRAWRKVQGELRGSDVATSGFRAVWSGAIDDRQAWVTRAACRGVDPEQLFVEGAAQRAATAICRHCQVQVQCLADALDNQVPFGVWGGRTVRERRALLRSRPDVTSWSDHLGADRRGAAPPPQTVGLTRSR